MDCEDILHLQSAYADIAHEPLEKSTPNQFVSNYMFLLNAKIYPTISS